VDEEDENASSGDEDEMDDQMGDIGNSELNEKLDDKLWGDDDKSDEQDNQVNIFLYYDDEIWMFMRGNVFVKYKDEQSLSVVYVNKQLLFTAPYLEHVIGL